MVVNSCWGHHCWSLNLAQLTGYAHTNWLKVVFVSILEGIDALIYIHPMETCRNPDKKNSLYPKNVMFWLFLPQNGRRFDKVPTMSIIKNKKSLFLQTLNEHTLKLILLQTSCCCQTFTDVHTHSYAPAAMCIWSGLVGVRIKPAHN